MGVHGVPWCVVSPRWGQIDSIRGPPDLMVPPPPPVPPFLSCVSLYLVSVREINAGFASRALHRASLKRRGGRTRIKRERMDVLLVPSVLPFLLRSRISWSISGNFISRHSSAFPAIARGFPFKTSASRLSVKGTRNRKLQLGIWRCWLRVRKSILMHAGVDERKGGTPAFFSRRALHLARASARSKCSGEMSNPLLHGALYYEKQQCWLCRYKGRISDADS